MSELTPRARDLIDAAGQPALAPAKKETLRAGLLEQLSAGAPDPLAGETLPQAAAATGAGGALKVLAVIAAVGAGTVATWQLAQPEPPPAKETSGPVEPRVSPAPPATVAPAPPSPTPAPARQPQRKKSPTLDVAGEAALLLNAKRALGAQDPQGAEMALREYRRRYPRGSLAEEYAALRAMTRCQGEDPTARQKAKELFLHDFPQSPFADRVVGACADQKR